MSIVLVFGGLLLAAMLAGIARYERSPANEHLPGSRPGGPRDMVPHGAVRPTEVVLERKRGQVNELLQFVDETRAPRPLPRRRPEPCGKAAAVGEALARAIETSQTGFVQRWPRMTPTAPSPRARMGRSRLGGVSTALPPPPAFAARQLALALGPAAGGKDAGQGRREPCLPGVVHIAGWLDLETQRSLVAQFRRWALPPAGLRHPRVPSGHLMSVQSVCLGWHWEPYAYSKTADDTDGAPVKPLPKEVSDLARAAVAEAYGRDSAEAATYAPDAAIVNLYAPGAHLGLHQDGEEPSDAPVVTVSLGDSCVFRFAGVGRRTGPFTDLELRSGDLLVFGEPNRRIHHGVPRVLDGTAPGGLGLPPGRLSITVRETGL